MSQREAGELRILRGALLAGFPYSALHDWPEGVGIMPPDAYCGNCGYFDDGIMIGVDTERGLVMVEFELNASAETIGRLIREALAAGSRAREIHPVTWRGARWAMRVRREAYKLSVIFGEDSLIVRIMNAAMARWNERRWF